MNQFSFKNKSKDGIICFICGFLVCCLFNFVKMQGNRYMGIIAGIIICIFGLNSFLFNHNAFIQIENNHIRGKYHWFSKINCSISDIVFVLPQMNTISIILKNGKRYAIMGIENPWKFYSEIISKIAFDISDSTEVLIEKLNLLKAKKKKYLVYCCSMVILMFLNIFIIVFLTNGKEINEFNKKEWIIFVVMSVIEMVTVILAFYFAQKTGLMNLPIKCQQYCIKRTIIETKPLLPGYIVAVYSDVDFMMRVTVFGYPHKNDVYAAVQLIEDYDNFVIDYNTATYDTLDELLDDFGDLIEITDKFFN